MGSDMGSSRAGSTIFNLYCCAWDYGSEDPAFIKKQNTTIKISGNSIPGVKFHSMGVVDGSNWTIITVCTLIRKVTISKL